MKLIPKYPTKLFIKNYRSGLITGILLGSGIAIILLDSIIFGLAISLFSIIIYYIQNIDRES